MKMCVPEGTALAYICTAVRMRKLDCALLEPDFYCLSAQAIQTMTRRLGKASSIRLKQAEENFLTKLTEKVKTNLSIYSCEV